MKMNRLVLALGSAALAFGATGCTQNYSSAKVAAAPTAAPAPMPKDGELDLPANYRNWPVFLKDIQRKDLKQIRDIYVNDVGARTKAGEMFPNGTWFVMDLFSVKLNPDGTPMLDANGNMTRDKLSRVFLMAKGAGWGANVPAEVRNGDWIYTAFEGDGRRGPADQNACRVCHLPQAAKDYVFHYDKYFQSRMSFEGTPLSPLTSAQLAALPR